MSLGKYDSIKDREIYTDLLREFIAHGSSVVILSPIDSDDGKEKIVREKNCVIIKVITGKIQKTNIFEKGINTVLLENRFKSIIKKQLGKVKFDLVLFPTPPITLAGAVEYVKKRDHAKTYLLLKDIFPQNAVDIGMMSKSGAKGMLYKYFRRKEKKLYALSDHIGCMSQANVEYVLKHNSEIEKYKVEVCPNGIEPMDISVNDETRIIMRRKYDIPINKTVFVYGGNLGKPQGIPFLIKCLHSQKNNENAFFLIVGSGTDYGMLDEYIKKEKPKNVKLMSRMLKNDYDAMVGSCDVGMIFLDHRFTIPNFPSRLLSYMQAKIPVLAVTDPCTDIGKVITENGFGWWCESNDVMGFSKTIEMACRTDKMIMGMKAWKYLNQEYTAKKGYQVIIHSLNGDK